MLSTAFFHIEYNH